MWIALLVLTWFVEGVVGVWFCYHYWMFTQFRYYGDTAITGPGYEVVRLYNGFVSTAGHHSYVLTQERLALFFVVVYIALHLFSLVRGLVAPYRERRRLGVRCQPSGREIQRFEQVYTGLARAHVAIPGAPPLKRPWVWRVRDDDQGMQMRFIGFVLVVDRGLLYSGHFPALLARELAHTCSFDLLTRSMYTIFPPFPWCVLTPVGLPCACGPILFHLAWMRYWRDRVFAGDEYAARLGQGRALKSALDELRWVLDGGRATRGGRLLRETPYIEERIDHLDRYQPLSHGPAGP